MVRSRVFFRWLLLAGMICQAQLVFAQAVPYARTYARSKEDVDSALKELQAYAGQKLPIVDGFVAMGAEPLDRYERAFYQFSIDIFPATPGSCVVRVSAKITAWYADKDPAKSGYRVLPSNGRLELDLLDRLTEKFGGKTAGITSPSSSLQMPRPKLDAASGLPVNSGGRTGSSAGTMVGGETIEEMAILKLKRETEEKHAQQLNTELQNLLELERNQAHPQNLVVVKKSGTPVLARAAPGSKILFQAAADDEFEFIDADGEWIHVQISGASRGYLRRNMVELPELLARRLKPASAQSEANEVLFRVTREEAGVFPGNWEKLKGKMVKIFTVQPAVDGKKTEAAEKVAFAESIFERFGKDSGEAISTVDGAVIIFDSADGGIIAATQEDVKERAGGLLPREEFLKRSYTDPVSAFNPEAEK